MNLKINDKFGKLTITHVAPVYATAVCDCGKIVKYKIADIESGKNTCCGVCARDLTGHKYDKLTVIKQAGFNSAGNSLWLCRCDCGNEVIKSNNYLHRKNKFIKSCNSCNDDLVGKVFHSLTVVKYAYNKNNKKYWECLCECGGTVCTPTNSLTSGKRQHCDSFVHKIKDISGQRFGKLFVESFSHVGNGGAYFNCVCDCGTRKVVHGSSLTAGRINSCGCSQHTDWVGKKFGMLLAIEDLGYQGRYHMIRCRCDCGKVVDVIGGNLTKGNSTSCGCGVCRNSQWEESIADYLSSFVDVKRNVRILGDGKDKRKTKEIDIYIPNLNLGIETNGSVFHSSVNGLFRDVPVTYHQEKFLLAKSMGIHLINIFDVDWQNNQDKIKSYLLDLVKKPIKLYARQCEIRKISSSEANSFCDEYHLHGSTRANSICYGLFFNDELYSVMTFGHVRYKSNNSEYELYRYCVKSGYSIVGGASKLLKHFLLDYCPTKVVSYSDNDYFLGDIYPKLDFRYDKQCALSYFWFGSDIRKREQCQAHKLKEAYPELYQKAIDEGASNKENFIMTALGYKKVFRSGNTRWIYENQ